MRRPLVNPIWIAVNMAASGAWHSGWDATAPHDAKLQTLRMRLIFAVAGGRLSPPPICNDSRYPDARSGRVGSETQFAFRGVLQEEKPLRDWLQEVLMNCLGYYTFLFGKLKIGIRENSSAVEAFTEGNIAFRSLQLAPVKPTFNHLTANFADQDFDFVANSVALYDIDHASRSAAARVRSYPQVECEPLLAPPASRRLPGSSASGLREELGGHQHRRRVEKRPASLSFKTTVLALNTEPGMVVLDDAPGYAGRVRRVPRHLLEAEQRLQHRHSGPHDDGLDV